MLLTMFKDKSPTVKKYTQVAKTLENTEGFKIENRIFVSSSVDVSKLRTFTDAEKSDFSKNENTFSAYMNKCGDLKYHEFSNKTQLIYANLCTFESRWQLNKHSRKKIYNSFNYTDDIRYEGRLMELPLCSEDFKLVLVLPNESNVWLVNTLFATLTNQGLSEAISSIHPLFTADTVLSTAMSFNVKSRVEIKEKIRALTVIEVNGLAIQYGTIAVSDEGIRVKVLTCLYLPADKVINNAKDTFKPATSPPSSPFYFAIVYQDTPIFYGDFKTRYPKEFQ